MASKAPKPLELPAKLQKLYDFMQGKGDTPILDIYRHVLDREPTAAPRSEHRYAQQELGTHITRLNRRLREHKQVVRPGRIKGTYVLVAL